MTYYTSADPHLGHSKVLEFETDRKGFEQTLNHLVNLTKKDVLICLGDLAFSEPDYWVRKYRASCEAKIILVKGNHDKKSYSWYYDRGIDFVCEAFEMYFQGKVLRFTHRPTISLNGINVHGHMHRPMSHHDYSFYCKNNILVDTRNDCMPISLEYLLKGKV